MRVSIIIPTRNRPEALTIAVQSVANQTHGNLEIIVVDDGSSSENAALNEQMVSRIARETRYLALARDTSAGSGPSRVRNAGIAAATGELIGFCDDDDFWCDSGHLSAVAEVFAGRGTLDLVFANQAAHQAGKKVRDVWLPVLEEDLAKSPAWQETPAGGLLLMTRRQCLLGHFPHMNTCITRRELAQRIGGFWEIVRYHEDLDFFVRLLDVTRDVGFRKQTVSVHNIPDRSLAASASSQLAEDEKHLVNVVVATHLIQSCNDAACRQYAKRMAKDAFRHLASRAWKESRHRRAADYARLAFASNPSFRGAIYAAGVSLSAVFR